MTNLPADFYGVPLVGVTEHTDTITLSHTAASSLTQQYIVSVPAEQEAGAAPTGDVLSVYDVTTSTALAEGTDYTLVQAGSPPETITWKVLRVNTSTASADGDSARVTYRFGTVPDTSFNAGDFQGNDGPLPAGTAFEASVQATTGSTEAGIGDQAAGGSLTDPANGLQGGPETGVPGSEYAVSPTHPSDFGWNDLGTPDTEAVYGGDLPESFTPASTAYSGTLDTTVAGGSNLVPGMFTSPPGYRAPSAGVAAATKDTTLTDILGNQINDNPQVPPSGYAANNIDTLYVGAPARPTSLASQTDAFAAAAAATRYYLTQGGLVPSSVTGRNTTTSASLVLGTDYAVTTAGAGPTTAAYVTLTAGTNFTAGNSVSFTYSYGDATYWDSNMPASVPGTPSVTSVTAVNRGADITWAAPSGTVYIQYYLLQSTTLGTMYVPYTGQPVNYGQTSPGGGATYGQPTFQSDTLALLNSALAAPAAPSPTNATTGGTVAAGVYGVKVTYVNGNGESVASTAGTTTTTTATSTLTVPTPAAETGATGWYAYVTAVGGSTYYRQQAAGHPTAVGTGLTLTAPPVTTGATAPAADTTLPVLTKTGILTPPAQVIVKDLTSSAVTELPSGEIAGGEADPLQADGFVLEYGYDYTVTVTGTGPWTSYKIVFVPGSVNAKLGDTIQVDYWYGADPSSVSAVFTQGLYQNIPPVIDPNGDTVGSQGYAFRVAAGNQAGLGNFSAWSSYVVPLNYNEPQANGSINVGTGSLDPANTINPIYRPDGTVHAGTGLGG
jgi:hypothetical protein